MFNETEFWHQVGICEPSRQTITGLTQRDIDRLRATLPIDHPLECDDGAVLSASGFVYTPAELEEMIPVELPIKIGERLESLKC